MPDPRWTDETRKLVIAVLNTAEQIWQTAGEDADAVLAALAEAGLLLPPGGETRLEWGVRSRAAGQSSWVPTLLAPREEYARAYAEQRVTLGGFAEARVMRRTTHTGPWVEVPNV